MAKRERTVAASDEGDAKQRKVEQNGEKDVSPSEELLKPFMDELEKIQKNLQDLDEQCAKKQMQVQQEFDASKKPIFNQRQKVLDKIPGFWGQAIRNHHMFAFMSDDDEPFLKFLQSVQLDDNLDDAGSYRIKFVFSEGAKAHFSPLELVKEVRFNSRSSGDEEVVEATSINWVDKEKNPIALVLKQREKAKEEDAEDEETEAAPWSFFEWFTKDEWPETRPDVGEVIRREIWHSPVAYFLGDVLSEDDDDELSEELEDSDDEDGNE